MRNKHLIIKSNDSESFLEAYLNKNFGAYIGIDKEHKFTSKSWFQRKKWKIIN